MKIYIDGVAKSDLEIDSISLKTIGANPPPLPPPTPPPPLPPPIVIPPSEGNYSKEVVKSIKLTQKTGGQYGFYKNPTTGEGQEFHIDQGSTVWFLVDPKSVMGSIANVRVQFTDFLQGDNVSAFIHVIDSSDNLYSGIPSNPWRVPLSRNTYGPWSPRQGYDDSKRYLIKVVENGTRDTLYNIYWWGY